MDGQREEQKKTDTFLMSSGPITETKENIQVLLLPTKKWRTRQDNRAITLAGLSN